MKLFDRTPGYWLFYVSAAYLIGGMWHIYKGHDVTLAGPIYIFFLALPFMFPPLGRSMKLDVTWDKKMFDFFKKKDTTPSNVVKFPEPKTVPPAPEVKPPKEDPAKIFYRFGVTDNNRLAFQMGYSEITMSKNGVQNLIDQLEVFKNQLVDETDNE